MATPYVLVSVGTVASTQHEARSRYRDRPVLVSAERQTGGRGRLGRDWVHAPRAVAASLCLEPGWPDDRLGLIPLVAGLAGRDAAGEGVRLAWPNDLIRDGRKVGGILSEADGALVVVGMGLNLFWPEPIEGAGALLGSDPGPEAPEWIAEQWAAGLLERLAGGPDHWGRDEYLAVSATVGLEVTWQPDGPGSAVDIDADGGLVVEVPGGRKVLRSGEVREVRSAG